MCSVSANDVKHVINFLRVNGNRVLSIFNKSFSNVNSFAEINLDLIMIWFFINNLNFLIITSLSYSVTKVSSSIELIEKITEILRSSNILCNNIEHY